MKKNYQTGFKKYVQVECSSKEEEQAVQELNKMTDAFIKSEKNYHSRTVSIDSSSSEECLVEIPDEEESVLEKMIYKEKYAPLYDAISKLPSIQQTIFVFHVLDEMSFSMIAEKMGYKSKNSVKKHYDKALETLQNLLKDFK